MTLNRLMIVLGVLVFFAGGGIAWLWQYAYTPQGRARNILTEVRGDTSTPRGWLIAHGIIRKSPPVFEVRSLQHEPVGVFDAAHVNLAKIGPECLPVVIEALKDPNSNARWTAVLACGDMREARAVEPLVDCYHNSPADVRLPCVCVLGSIGSPKAVPLLLEASKDRDSQLRENALRSLVTCWGKNALPTLVETLQEDESQEVRAIAAVLLGELRDKRAVKPLTGCLENLDEDENVAYSALVSLGWLNDRVAIPALLKAMEHKEPGVQLEAAGLLADLGEEKGFDFLLAHLRDKNGVDANVVILLGTANDKRAVGPLMAVANDKDRYVRVHVARALGCLGDPRAVETLQTMLKDSDPDVRERAAEALEKLGIKLPLASQPGNP